jgi:hypothetical protein
VVARPAPVVCGGFWTTATAGASVLVVGLVGEGSLRLFLDDFLSTSPPFLLPCCCFCCCCFLGGDVFLFLFPLRLWTPLAATGEVDLPRDPFATAPPLDALPEPLALSFSCCLRAAKEVAFFGDSFSSFLFLSLAAVVFLDAAFFLEGCGSRSSLGARLRVLGAAAPAFLLGPAPLLSL